MDTLRWTTVRELFESALEVPAAERGAWLDARTDNAELRSQVLVLLAQEERSGGLLSRGASLAHPPWNADDLVGRTVGGYSIERVLARGGMGVVYEARQHVPRRDVALKTLHSPYVDQEAQRRFRMEVEVLGLLQHPGIAQVFDGGVLDVDGRPVPYLAMELVPDARDLVHYAEEAALDLRRRRGLFIEERLVAEALALRGKTEAALDALEKAERDRTIYHRWQLVLLHNEVFATLRDHPRFLALVERIQSDLAKQREQLRRDAAHW